MSNTAPVLPKDMKKKEVLIKFLQYCETMQIEAVKQRDPIALCTWIKEARLARRELAALYRAKEKYDVELERDRKKILGIIRRLKSQGVNASVVERAHYITLCEEVS
ncbi:Phage related protein [Bacillus mycoides]|nr:Phage related protein [Bacillus mycoides]